MKMEDHCDESVRLFGDAFREVHLWLDEYASTPLGARHRRRRHHLAGIEEVRKRWGDKAAEAARQHIASDLKDEGWRDGQGMPRDEAEYLKMGFFG